MVMNIGAPEGACRAVPRDRAMVTHLLGVSVKVETVLRSKTETGAGLGRPRQRRYRIGNAL